MVPNIAKSGRSFRGAGKYYLHDKAAEGGRSEGERDGDDLPAKPTTDDRVWFTDTRNCVNSDPVLALDEMWATAEAQNELKRAAGLSLAGRKCTDPVKTISLSWHPSEQPTPELMIAAADGYLAKMGWQEHQAVYVGHNDTEHAHIHIILNRVHPETGRVLDDHKDFRRAQEWALDYEREHGRIFCEKRLDYESVAAKREHPANDNIPHDVIHLTRDSERQFKEAELSREARDQLQRDQLKFEQRAEREDWFADGAKLFRATRNAVWREVKEEYREDWKQFYAERSERLEEARQASTSALDRAFHFAKSGDWDQARSAFGDRDAVVRQVQTEFAERAQRLRAEQRDEVRERQMLACDALRLIREEGYKELLQRQGADRSEMREVHAEGRSAEHLLGAHQPAATRDDPVLPPVAPRIALSERDATEAEDGRLVASAITSGDGKAEPLMPGAMAPEFTIALPEPAYEDRDSALIRDTALTGAADLGAGMIGGAASYIADQLGEFVAPTPPEVREARARAAEEAKERAAAAKPANPYLRHAGDAEQKARDDRDREERDRYWGDERERRRER